METNRIYIILNQWGKAIGYTSDKERAKKIAEDTYGYVETVFEI